MGSYSRTAYLAIKKETTENVAVTPDVFVPFLSESIAAELSGSFSKSIVGTRAVNYDIVAHAIPAPAGEITLNVEPLTFGHFLLGVGGAVVTGRYVPVTTMGNLQVGETVTGGTSAATATIIAISSESDYLLLGAFTGSFTDGETITGGTSSETAVLTKADNSVYGHEFVLPQTTIDNTYTVEIGYDEEVVRYTGVRFHEMALNQTENLIIAKIKVSARAQFRMARVTEVEASGAGAHTVLVDQTTGLAASDVIKVFRPSTGAFLDFSASSVLTHTVGSLPTETSLTFTNLQTALAVGDLIVLAPQTETYSVEKEFTWAGGSVLRVGATLDVALAATPDDIEDFELNVINNIEPRHAANGLNHVNRYPAKVFTKGFDAKGKLMRTYTDVTYLDKLRSLRQFAISMKSVGGIIATAIDFNYMLDIRVPNGRHLPFQPSIAEDDLLNQDMEFQVLPDLSYGYTAKVLLVNTEAEY